jgi:putative hydrolase of HD superfamily
MDRRKADTVSFILSAMRLKELRRTGWVRKAKIKDAESVSDHSYMVALISLLYGELFGLDSCKMVKIAILHDIAEVRTGDLMPLEKPGKREEERAFHEVASLLPPELSRRLSALWREYTYASSKEARIVKEIDKLEMALQGIRYQGISRSKALRQLTRAAGALVKDKNLKSWRSAAELQASSALLPPRNPL